MKIVMSKWSGNAVGWGVAVMMGLGAGADAKPVAYEVDAAHSAATFRIRHMLSRVSGSMPQIKGMVWLDEQAMEKSAVAVTLQASLIHTGVERRDNHLRSADFFDVEKFPEIVFVSEKVTNVKGSAFNVQGLLTLHGVTKPVTLAAEALGSLKTAKGEIRSFVATVKLNRKDFGLTWNRVVEAGTMLVGEEVEITLELEAMAKEEKKP